MLDEGIQHPWHEEVVAATSRFRQGHLVERPPFFYSASLVYPVWDVTRGVAEAETEPQQTPEIVELDAAAVPPYGVITNQTCEVAEESATPMYPWVQVAPVYLVEADSPLLARDYIFTLTSQSLPPGTWVADLRTEMPLEKGILVGRAPIEGFAIEADEIAFGRFLGRRRERAALASVFQTIIVATMKRKRDNNTNRARRIKPAIYKLKLAIDGNRLAPRAAQLHVIVRGDISDEVKEWFNSWWDRASEIATQQGVALLENQYWSSREVDVERYDDLVEIRIPF